MKNSNDTDKLLIKKIEIQANKIHVWFDNGQQVVNPLELYPSLLKASAKEQKHYELIGDGEGVHWIGLDLDLSAEGLLCGYREKFPAPPPMNKSRGRRFIRVVHSSPQWWVMANLSHACHTSIYTTKKDAISAAKKWAIGQRMHQIEFVESNKSSRKLLTIY